MMDSKKEAYLFQNVYMLLNAVDNLKRYMEYVSSASHDVVAYLEQEYEQKMPREPNSAAFRKQKMHRRITDRQPTPIASHLNLSTSSSKSTKNELQEDTIPETDEVDKKEEPTELVSSTNHVEYISNGSDIEHIRSLSVSDTPSLEKFGVWLYPWKHQSCNMAYDPESVYLRDFEPPSPISTTHCCDTCVFENSDENSKSDKSVVQFASDIEDSLYTSVLPESCLNENYEGIEELEEDEPCSECLQNCNQPSVLDTFEVKSRNCKTTHAEISRNSQCATTLLTTPLSTLSESILSLPSVEERPVNNAVDKLNETLESSWCTISDFNLSNEPVLSKKFVQKGGKHDIRRSTKIVTTPTYVDHSKCRDLHERLAVMAANHNNRKSTPSCCKHHLYCTVCGRQYKVHHVAVGKQKRNNTTNRFGFVSQLVDKWENLSNNGRIVN